MVMSLALLIAGTALVGAVDDVPQRDVAYACAITGGDDDEVDPRRHADFNMVQHGSSPTAHWTIARPGRPEIDAAGFEAEFGSVGGSVGLRWHENGAEKTAYISFSDVRLADGSSSFWMSMDRPSLWQGAGIICQSGPAGSGAGQ
jgi:hypothetical protein